MGLKKHIGKNKEEPQGCLGVFPLNLCIIYNISFNDWSWDAWLWFLGEEEGVWRCSIVFGRIL